MIPCEFETYENLDIKHVPVFSLKGLSCWCRVIQICDGDKIMGIIKLNSGFNKISIKVINVTKYLYMK